jgi:hypothetical protein
MATRAICNVDECPSQRQRSSGFCARHHARWEMYGDPRVHAKETRRKLSPEEKAERKQKLVDAKIRYPICAAGEDELFARMTDDIFHTILGDVIRMGWPSSRSGPRVPPSMEESEHRLRMLFWPQYQEDEPEEVTKVHRRALARVQAVRRGAAGLQGEGCARTRS